MSSPRIAATQQRNCRPGERNTHLVLLPSGAWLRLPGKREPVSPREAAAHLLWATRPDGLELNDETATFFAQRGIDPEDLEAGVDLLARHGVVDLDRASYPPTLRKPTDFDARFGEQSVGEILDSAHLGQVAA